MGLEFVVERVCDGGKKMSKHMRFAKRVRGSITIEQINDPTRRRTVLVATFHPVPRSLGIPPLHDVTLIHGTGECWTLTGHERVHSGPLHDEMSFTQTWRLEMAAVQDIIDMGNKWNAAAGEAHELREQLARLTRSADGRADSSR
jgi:hypothetical protein